MWRLFGRIEQALSPDFDSSNNGLELKRAFTLLIRVILIFAAAIFLWSLAAGALRAGWWVSADNLPPPGFLVRWRDFPIAVLAVIGAAVLGAKTLAVTGLMAMAAGLAGGFLGFLFGLPSRAGQPPAAVAGGEAGRQSPATAESARWAPSTNLIQISDWLTKTIVGVTLVEAKPAFEQFVVLCEAASQRLLGGAFGSSIVVPAVLIGAGVLGFKMCNLYTLLFLARLIAEAGITIETLSPQQLRAVETLKQHPPPLSSIHVTRLPENFVSAEQVGPTHVQREAAIELRDVPLSQLSTFDAILAWARSQAVLNRYAAAAEGYRKLIPLMQPRDPAILAEAARVIAQVGAYDEARTLLNQALEVIGQRDPNQRISILRDYVVLLLYRPKPESYTETLALLDNSTVDADKTGELALLRACANGQKYANDGTLNEEEKKRIRDQVIADVKTAIERGQSKDWIAYLASPDAGKPPPGSPEREDDLEPFYNDPDFMALLQPASPGPP